MKVTKAQQVAPSTQLTVDTAQMLGQQLATAAAARDTPDGAAALAQAKVLVGVLGTLATARPAVIGKSDKEAIDGALGKLQMGVPLHAGPEVNDVANQAGEALRTQYRGGLSEADVLGRNCGFLSSSSNTSELAAASKEVRRIAVEWASGGKALTENDVTILQMASTSLRARANNEADPAAKHHVEQALYAVGDALQNHGVRAMIKAQEQ